MPSIGSVRLHDSIDPALDSGSYRIRSISDTRDAARPLAESIQRLEIVGPRFALEPADVLSRRPAADAVGAFGEDLPYIVLSRRTLPWERRGLGASSPPNTPWLALLVMRQSECELRENVAIADVVGAARASRFPAGTKVRSVTVKAPRTLQQLLPRAAELALLCHAREVNLADTALAMSDDDGWFAIVAANRIPIGSDAPGTPYVACLVSLEERDDLLGATPATQALVVLDAWSFTSTLTGGTFRRLIWATSQQLFGAGAPTSSGHVVLGATDRAGAPGRAAYRGPLTGHLPGPTALPAPDRSLDVARELGRLLAAADGRFLRELIAWRRNDALAAAGQASAAVVSGALSDTAPTRRSAAAANASLPAVAALAAVTRALGRRPRPADRWGVPDVAREQAERLTSAPPRTVKQAAVPLDPMDELRRERDRIIAKEAS
jgi:hypothetical protein